MLAENSPTRAPSRSPHSPQALPPEVPDAIVPSLCRAQSIDFITSPPPGRGRERSEPERGTAEARSGWTWTSLLSTVRAEIPLIPA